MAWIQWFPSNTPILINGSHLWTAQASKLYSFNTFTQFYKLPFYTVPNSKVVILTKVENGGLIVRVEDSSGNKEAEEYVEGEGQETTLQIEVETINTTGALRYLTIEGLPDGGFTESIYDLIILLVTEGGGWSQPVIPAGVGWGFQTIPAGGGWTFV